MKRFAMPYWSVYREEVKTDAGEAGGGGAGGEESGDLNVNIEEASAQIGAELGLGDDDKGGETDLDAGSASSPPVKGDVTPPADKAAQEAKARVEKAGKVTAAKAELTAKKLDFTGRTDDEILALAAPAAVAAPKSWKKEMHEHFDKAAPEVQAYIAQREAEIEEGFRGYAEKSKYGETMRGAMQPYEALLTAQGVKPEGHDRVLRTLLNAHYVLSTEQPEGRASFMAGLMKNYGVDLAALTAAVGTAGAQQQEETPAVKELRARTDRLEHERRTELSNRVEAVKAQTAAEVEAFASDPKHPYFKEVAGEMTLMLANPAVTMEQAYESAVWANPVTRAKENARIKTEAEALAKAEADKAAEAALKARSTKVRGDPTERESPDLLGSMEDTMRGTLKNIKSRQEG